jgi:DNA-binding GntR family transcriptional regulator
VPVAAQPPRDSTSALAPIGRDQPRSRTSDRVYAELVSAIRELRLEPGASLSESDLAVQLQVSRTPLREAIARLVDHGLVSVVPQVGTRVERIRLSDVEQARFVRETLEIAAAAVVCGTSERDVHRLRELLVEQERCHESHDFDGFFRADEEMHGQIFAMSGYSGAWEAVQRMKLQLDRLRRLNRGKVTVRELIDEHAAIVDALEAGDVQAASEHVSRHARRVLEYGPALRAQYPQFFTE